MSGYKNLHGDGRQQRPTLAHAFHPAIPPLRVFSKLCNYDNGVCRIPPWSHKISGIEEVGTREVQNSVEDLTAETNSWP